MMSLGSLEGETPEPRISVLIPCFNLGRYLDEAVESVLAQTYQDFEILIVDDGSTDPDTVRLFDGYQRPKTTVFRTPNQKLAGARNFLLARARGEFICALDADDKLHPQYFEKTIAVLEHDPSLVFVSTRMQMFGADTRIRPDALDCDLPTLLLDDPLHCAALTRRSAILAVGCYDEGMKKGNEDWDLSLRLLEAGGRGVVLPDVLFYYRRRPGSMCDDCTRGPLHLELMDFLFEKHERSFSLYAPDLLKAKESRILEYAEANAALDAQLNGFLIPAVERRRDELRMLEARLELAKRDPLESSRVAYESALAEVEALRNSRSWRITAPIRAIYDWISEVGWRRRS